MRELYLRLDDEPERILKFGDTTEFAPIPGPHRLVATNRLFTKRIELELGPNQEICFVAVNVSMGCLSATALATGIGVYGVDLVRLENV